MTISNWAYDHPARFGDYEALIDGRSVWTSSGLLDQAARMASGLIDLGVTPGDRVVLVLPFGREALVASDAVWRCGAVAVFAVPGMPLPELERVIGLTRPAAIVCQADECVGGDTGLPTIVTGDPFEAVIATHRPLPAPVPREPTDLAQLIISSGTSGLPKLVEISHGSLEARMRQRQAAVGDDVARQEQTAMHMLPAASFGGLHMLARFVRRTRLVALRRFDPATALELIERHRVNMTVLVPMMAEMLLACAERQTADTSSLHEITISGDHVSLALSAAVANAFGVPPTIIYGMSEVGGGIASVRGERREGSVGHLLPGVQVEIVDSEGRVVPGGETGEVRVRTPWMGRGYFGDPEQTARVFRSGWVLTGDLGRLGSDGELFLLGRRKQVVIRGGYNILPQEVVEVLARIPGVQEAAAVGVRSEVIGEELVACIVREPGAMVTAEDVIARCRAELDPRKLPGRVEFRASLPHTRSGKLDLIALRAELEAAQARPAPSHGDTELYRRIAAAPAERRSMLLVEEVTAQVRRRLRRPDPIEQGATFGDLGLGSVDVVSLARELGERLGFDLPVIIAFRHPTVAALADHLASRFGSASVRSGSVAASTAADEPIAVIGLGCRLPGTDGPAAFWRLLAGGIDTSREPPPGRWAADTGQRRARLRGSYVDRIDEFDARFFRLGLEADRMDPQHRWLLEVTWEALEDAGCLPMLSGRTVGVFAGISPRGYRSGVGSAVSMAAAHICQFLDIRGPALTVDTACSSSLVALHHAVVALGRGDCEIAIVGGVNLLATLDGVEALRGLGVLAADGRSKAFAETGDGFGRGEGCAVVVLKRRSLAEADRDRIRALVLGSAAMHDGRSSSITAPNPRAQEEMISRALDVAGIDPDQVQYVEAHGTGTLLGDPIEVDALDRVFGRRSGPPLALGSVKTNVGHLEAGAGIVGLVKVVLALEHDELPASLHFSRPNPHIPWDRIPIRVQAERGPWPDPAAPRIAGVTSLGLSGAIAHAVLAQAPVDTRPAGATSDGLPRALPISARSSEALRTVAARLADELSADLGAEPERDIAYTASCRRQHLDSRLVVVGSDRAEWADRLRQHAATGDGVTGIAPEVHDRVAFVFSGQGGQWAGMGRQLASAEPVFAAALQACETEFRRHVDWSLCDELFATDRSRLDEDRIVQPALFAIQVALAGLLRAWGIEPTTVVGHSLGEVAAAHVAGLLGFEDAVRVICTRAELVGRIAGSGTMAAIGLPADEVERELQRYDGRLSLAGQNAPTMTTIAGDVDAIVALLSDLARREVFCRQIKVSYAAHSRHVDVLRDELMASLSEVAPQPVRAGVQFLSTAMLGGDRPSVDAAYWWRNLRDPVRLLPRIEQLREAGTRVFLEIGPHPVLITGLRDVLGRTGHGIETMRRDAPEQEAMLTAIGRLHCAGFAVPWQRQYDPPGRLVSLPSYPWQRERYWFEPPASHAGRRIAPLVHRHIELPHDPGTHLCELDLDLADPALSYLSEHKVGGEIRIPEAAVLELVREAVQLAHGTSPPALERVRFEVPLAVSPRQPRLVVVTLERDGGFTVHSRRADGAEPLARHAVGRAASGATPVPSARVDIAAARGRCTHTIASAELFAATEYGPAFHGVSELAVGATEAVGRLRPLAAAEPGLALDPTLVDAAIQVAGAVAGDVAAGAQVATEMTRIELCAPIASAAWVYARQTGDDGIELRVVDDDGQDLIRATGVRTIAVPRSAPVHSATTGVARELAEAAGPAERTALLEAYLCRVLAASGIVSAAELDRDTVIGRLGLDSLQLMSIRNVIEVDLDAIPALATIADGTIGSVAAAIEGLRAWGASDAPATDRLDLKPTGVSTCRATASQRFFWRLGQVHHEYNLLDIVLLLEGPLDRDLLANALTELTRRHASLRTTFDEVDGEVVQRVVPADSIACTVDFHDLSTLSGDDQERRQRELIRDYRWRPYDLRTDCGLRPYLCRLAAERHLLVILAHHIAVDGQAYALVPAQLAEIYAALAGGRPVAPAPLQYPDYADHLRRWSATDEARTQREFWRANLAGARPVDIPGVRDRDALERARGSAPEGIVGEEMFPSPSPLPPPIQAGAARLSQDERVTAHVVYMAGFVAFLHRVSGLDDLCFEAAYTPRFEHRSLEQMIAMFAYPLIMRASAAGAPTFRELIHRTREAIRLAQQHSTALAIGEFPPHPLRRINFNYLPFRVPPPLELAPGLTATRRRSQAASALRRRPWDIQLALVDHPDAPVGLWLFNERLFSRELATDLVQRANDAFALVLTPDARIA